MGTIVSGKIESGRIHKGQNVVIMPNKVPFSMGECLKNNRKCVKSQQYTPSTTTNSKVRSVAIMFACVCEELRKKYGHDEICTDYLGNLDGLSAVLC
jgi:translation elongation factor EF-1alpha